MQLKAFWIGRQPHAHFVIELNSLFRSSALPIYVIYTFIRIDLFCFNFYFSGSRSSKLTLRSNLELKPINRVATRYGRGISALIRLSQRSWNGS